MGNISCENEFDLLENGHAGDTHFYKKIFTQRLILTQRHWIVDHNKFVTKLLLVSKQQICYQTVITGL